MRATLHPAVAERLGRLAPDQRAAATAPPGPVLCVAPAGSGKTTTLVARVAWLVDRGIDPESLTVVAFNKRAAEELTERIDAALAPLGSGPATIRVRTFHALGLEILRSAGRPVRLVARGPLLRHLMPHATAAARMRADTALSRLKLESGVTAVDVAADPDPGWLGRLFLDYAAALDACGGLDFDDLVVEALRALSRDSALLAAWRERCRELLVDEVQDVDRSQLDLALLLAAPANHVFLVGDDDQCIYAWRLADVRRVLDLAARLPGLVRFDLTTNYRCPRPVVGRAVRLVEHNRERFAKSIVPGPAASGQLVLAPDPDEDVVRIGRVLGAWPADGSSRAVLARTNRELVPAVVAAVAAGHPFRADRLALLVEHPDLDALLQAAASTDERLALLRRLAAVRPSAGAAAPPPDTGADRAAQTEDRPTGGDPAAQTEDRPTGGDPADGPIADGRLDEDEAAVASPADLRRAVLAWAAPFTSLPAFAAEVVATRDRLRDLRRPDAPLALSTAHATKGLEFDHVAVVMDAHRFPSARSLAEADDPDRALEEERRLGYVAWTRARRSLTLLYDPAAPSRFLLEAFSSEELGVPRTSPRSGSGSADRSSP